MKNVIEQLIKQYPKHSVKKIVNDSALWSWVEQYCDPLSTSNAAKIFTAISGQRQQCSCGSGKLRKLKSLTAGFRFCGPAKQCSAATAQISQSCKTAANQVNKTIANEKRRVTCKEKFGVENVGSSNHARQRHKLFYQNASLVQNTVEKMQQTCLSKYGVKNPAQHTTFIQRRTKTYQQNCLTSHNREHTTQIKYPDWVFNILTDRDKFALELTTLGRTKLAEKLNVAVTTISRFHNKHGLNIINSSYSAAEIEITNFLNELNVSFKKDRTICKPKELDFFIPTHNLAIEYNGLYTHSQSVKPDKNYHWLKTQTCANQDIQLIHIFSDEWQFKQSICRSIIKQRLGLTSNRIFARNCQIKVVTASLAKEFLNQNHLQGYAAAKINLALFYNDTMVQLMTFGRPRFSKQAEFELIRLSNKLETSVIGGVEKLWKYFLTNYQPQSVVSYCDRRWFTGEIYKKLKFSIQATSTPTYWYTDYEKRFHRSKFMKKNCVKLALLQPNNTLSHAELQQLTEAEIATNLLGLDKVWDCGQDTWLWQKSPVITGLFG